ncbi:hypothetical protein fHeYen901_177 [Yersinia phage fHe-Yen9-01]|uniref:Baseplate wedge protein gp6 n=1 Tax=Yersinia phage fHe-Yen9-01 TaxID=1965363 RepID=A0A1V0DXT2_9CAUD|nr:baseplate wedge subunit [Yersinia phage fHe-Yen9-01]ARB05950.1 hypothetical protein fHeYen901_177 [Yersinia phage fHe-Yen9-01]
MAELTNFQLTKTANAIPEVFEAATFDEIKAKLIDWLKSQNEFKDYDFLGSRLNVLLDLLSYNTLYIQQFSNTAIYESFIRTANQRSSVVQAAQDSGYYPANMSAASISILLKVSHALNPVNIRIPRGTKFLAYAKGAKADPYAFVSLEDVVAVKDKDNFYWPIVKLGQGRIMRNELTYDINSPIIIRDPGIDRSLIRVFINGSEWTDWTSKSMVHAGSISTIYYTRETIDGNTEIYFGEGVASQSVAGGVLESNYIGGLKPFSGSNIVVEYIRTNGEAANGSTGFSYADTLTYISIDEVIENYENNPDFVGADGGGDPENIERIRELAVVKREAQMRCVTASDYESFISAQFGSVVQAVSCFTDSDKPGYAFISIKPKSGLNLTAVQREDMQNYLKEFNLAPITPSVISPNYLFIKHNVTVTYNLNKLQESQQWLESKIIEQIDNYYTEDVEIFNSSFSKSRMLTYVDNADKGVSIIGSSATIELVREIPNFYATPEAGIKYYNKVDSKGIYSSNFPYEAYEELTYDVRIVSTAADALGAGKMVIGPFRAGDIVESSIIQPYIGTDFEKLTNQDGRDTYFVVGELNYFSDYIYWNLGAIDVDSTKFPVQSIELYAEPSQDNIFAKDGTLIVFENDLRPQYTTIIMEPITG